MNGFLGAEQILCFFVFYLQLTLLQYLLKGVSENVILAEVQTDILLEYFSQWRSERNDPIGDGPPEATE